MFFISICAMLNNYMLDTLMSLLFDRKNKRWGMKLGVLQVKNLKPNEYYENILILISHQY